MFCCVVQDYLKKKTIKYKQYKQKTGPENYKTKIQILANPGLT